MLQRRISKSVRISYLFVIFKQFKRIDEYEIIRKIYDYKEILLSNWGKANYMTEDKEYIIVMPFLNIEKLHELNVFFNNKSNENRKINIITLAENIEKINETLIKDTKIIELDNWLWGIADER